MLENTELAGWQLAEEMLATIEMPEIKFTLMRSTDTTRAKTTQGHTMTWAIINVAGIAHSIGTIPALLERSAPTLQRNRWPRWGI
jgi:hypothetical protein